VESDRRFVVWYALCSPAPRPLKYVRGAESALQNDRMGFRITSSANDHGTTIRVEGRLTIEGVRELEKQFQLAEKPVQLDLSGLISLDDQGVWALKALSVGGATLRGASPYVRQLLGYG
jgi:anti-anti-sigma regulatory factor